MDNAQEKIDRRSEIEATFNRQRKQLEVDYTADKAQLETAYHADLRSNRVAKEAALVAAGLNSDGSDPQERPTG